MKKKVKLISFLLVACLLTVPVSATQENSSGLSTDKSHESSVISAILNHEEIPGTPIASSEPAEEGTISILRMSNCKYCQRGQLFLVCAGEAAPLDTGTHQYGFLWQNTCNIVYLQSRSAYMCDYCHLVNEMNGYHLCWEVHQDCGRGAVDCCICDIT